MKLKSIQLNKTQANKSIFANGLSVDKIPNIESNCMTILFMLDVKAK